MKHNRVTNNPSTADKPAKTLFRAEAADPRHANRAQVGGSNSNAGYGADRHSGVKPVRSPQGGSLASADVVLLPSLGPRATHARYGPVSRMSLTTVEECAHRSRTHWEVLVAPRAQGPKHADGERISSQCSSRSKA